MQSSINNLRTENIESNEEAVTSTNNNIQQDFKINIHDGNGFYETGVNNSFLVKLDYYC